MNSSLDLHLTVKACNNPWFIVVKCIGIEFLHHIADATTLFRVTTVTCVDRQELKDTAHTAEIPPADLANVAGEPKRHPKA